MDVRGSRRYAHGCYKSRSGAGASKVTKSQRHVAKSRGLTYHEKCDKCDKMWKCDKCAIPLSHFRASATIRELQKCDKPIEWDSKP